MRFSALTAVFLAIFALFSTVVYAAPASPQGAASKRCAGEDCRNAVVSPQTPTGSPDLLSNLLVGLITLVAGLQAPAPPSVQFTPVSPPASPPQPSTVQ